MAWVAKHINEQVLFHPRDVVTATEFNSLFNLLIAQGNNNSLGVEYLIEVFNSDMDGGSGADFIKVTSVDGVIGTTVQGTLEGLKGLIDQRYTKSETDNLLSFKATNETVAKLVKNVDFDENTGKFTFTFESGNTKVIDTAMEKIAINFLYDSNTQSLVLHYVDGSTESVSLAEFITNNEFADSNTIYFNVVDGIVKAEIGVGVIKDEMLDSKLLSEVAEFVAAAANSAQLAGASEGNAKLYAQLAVDTAQDVDKKVSMITEWATTSKSYAVGDTGSRQGEDTDNAKYYAERSVKSAESAYKSEQAAKEYRDEAKELSGGDFILRSEYDEDITVLESSINNKIVVYENVSVPVSAWSSDSTYSGYSYRAAIICSGVTTDYIPEVVFSIAEAIGGNFAPIADTGTNTVYIYAITKPTAAITLPTIEARKAVKQ